MSFSRFGWDDSDVYVFEHVGGFIQCCGCQFAEKDYESYDAKTPRDMLSHLERHAKDGDNVNKAVSRITEEYADLDIEIEPFDFTEYNKALDKLWEEIKVRDNIHPPQNFRDIGNAE